MEGEEEEDADAAAAAEKEEEEEEEEEELVEYVEGDEDEDEVSGRAGGSRGGGLGACDSAQLRVHSAHPPLLASRSVPLLCCGNRRKRRWST